MSRLRTAKDINMSGLWPVKCVNVSNQFILDRLTHLMGQDLDTLTRLAVLNLDTLTHLEGLNLDTLTFSQHPVAQGFKLKKLFVV